MSARPGGDGGGDATPRTFRFAEFVFDASSGELRHDGEEVALAPQPARVLEVLLGRAGEVVSRQELYAEVWGDDVHVDYRQGLNYCIRQVRIALGESAREPRFVETLPRRGYRFLVRPTSPVTEPGTADGSSIAAPATPQPRRQAWVGVTAVLVGLALLGLLAGLDGGSTDGRTTGGESVATVAAARVAPAALQSYLKARYLAGKARPELDRAVDEYEAALRVEPDFALAHAGLAEAYRSMTGFGGLPPDRGYSRSLAAADRALALGHETADLHVNRGIARLYRDLDWAAASRDFDRARRVEPGDARAWFWHARALSATGEHEAAVRAAERSLLLDPESRQVVVDLGWFHLLAGRYRDAVAQCERALDLEPGSIPALRCLIGAHLRLGDEEAARHVGRRLIEVFGASPDELAAQEGSAASTAGPSAGSSLWDRAGEYLADFCPHNSFAASRAVFYTAAGDHAAAIEQLEVVVRKRQGWAPFVALDPTFAELHDEPRFQALVSRIQVPSGTAGD